MDLDGVPDGWLDKIEDGVLLAKADGDEVVLGAMVKPLVGFCVSIFIDNESQSEDISVLISRIDQNFSSSACLLLCLDRFFFFLACFVDLTLVLLFNSLLNTSLVGVSLLSIWWLCEPLNLSKSSPSTNLVIIKRDINVKHDPLSNFIFKNLIQ